MRFDWRRALIGALITAACAVVILFALVVLMMSTARADGLASYYWQGARTATGERYNPDGISCAHKTLKFGTRVRVTNLRNGKSVECRINDRGPFIKGRVIDLSRGAARAIDMIRAGVVPVKIEVLP